MKYQVLFFLFPMIFACNQPVKDMSNDSTDPKEIYHDSLDAVAAAPASHEVLLENEKVRVLRVTIQPGEKEPMHHHQWESVMYVEQPSRIRYYDMNDVMRFESPEGQDFGDNYTPSPDWMGPEGVHAVENIDTIPFVALRVEIK